jgi:hypothetical protein
MLGREFETSKPRLFARNRVGETAHCSANRAKHIGKACALAVSVVDSRPEGVSRNRRPECVGGGCDELRTGRLDLECALIEFACDVVEI